MYLEEKVLLIYPNENEDKLSLYKQMVLDILEKYLDSINVNVTRDDIVIKYETAVIRMMCNIIEGSKSTGIKQKTQGSKSITYSESNAFIVSNDIKSLLPRPKVKLMG